MQSGRMPSDGEQEVGGRAGEAEGGLGGPGVGDGGALGGPLLGCEGGGREHPRHAARVRRRTAVVRSRGKAMNRSPSMPGRWLPCPGKRKAIRPRLRCVGRAHGRRRRWRTPGPGPAWRPGRRGLSATTATWISPSAGRRSRRRGRAAARAVPPRRSVPAGRRGGRSPAERRDGRRRGSRTARRASRPARARARPHPRTRRGRRGSWCRRSRRR